MNEFGLLRKNVDQMLLNNMNTRGVIMHFQTVLNTMSKSLMQSSDMLPIPILQCIVDYIEKWLLDVGFVSWKTEEIQLNQQGVLDTFCQFRKTIRDTCLLSLKSDDSEKDVCKKVLKECDQIRETVSTQHKITLIDGKEGLLWVTGELPKSNPSPKQSQKKGLTPSLPPSEMFKQSDAYSMFDERGIPTCDKSGKPLSASKLKKLNKQYNTHKAIHEKWLASQKYTCL